MDKPVKEININNLVGNIQIGLVTSIITIDIQLKGSLVF